MWPKILVLAGMAAMAFSVGYALIAGDRPARIVGGLVGAAWLGSWALQDRSAIDAPQYAVAGLDVVLAIALIVLVLRYRRVWLIAACAFQALTAATHLAFVVDTRIAALGFMTAYYVWSYATLLALVVGTAQAARAKRLGNQSALSPVQLHKG